MVFVRIKKNAPLREPPTVIPVGEGVTNEIIRLHGVRPPRSLPAPAELTWLINARFALLEHEGSTHPVFGKSPKRWLGEVDALVASLHANPDDDEALFKLCRLDPRYLGTDLAIAKLLDWKLGVIFSGINLTGSKPRRTPEQAEQARKRIKARKQHLRDLAASITLTTGKGPTNYRGRWTTRQHFAFYEAVFTNVRAELRVEFTNKRVRQLADKWDLTEDLVRRIKIAERVEGLVDEHLANEYGISANTVRAARTRNGGSRKR